MAIIYVHNVPKLRHCLKMGWDLGCACAYLIPCVPFEKERQSDSTENLLTYKARQICQNIFVLVLPVIYEFMYLVSLETVLMGYLKQLSIDK